MTASTSITHHPFLARAGLNLAAVFDCNDVPDKVERALQTLAPAPRALPQLLLLGAYGRRSWEALAESGGGGDDPVDAYSLKVARRFVAEHLGAVRTHFLYPGDFPLPLQSLGEALGWSHPSPLGLGIHPEYGLWFAWRAAFLADTRLTPTPRRTTRSPCLDCADKPCIATCPARAVHAAQPFGLRACAGHRLAPDSSCAATCLSRLACPVGAAHRYSEEQFAYHSQRALASMRRHLG